MSVNNIGMQMSAPRIFAIANQKGGVGKTTTAINLSAALALARHPVLLIDLDPQGNASTGLGIARDQRQPSSYELLVGQANLQETVQQTEIADLNIVPSTFNLSGVDIEMMHEKRRAYRLQQVLQDSGANKHCLQDYEYIFIDCPPALNLLTVNAMVAAGAIITPLQCEFFALEGLGQLMATIRRVQRNLNPDLVMQGVVLTMYDQRNNLSHQISQDVRSHLGERVYSTVIPRNVRLSEAPSHGKPSLIYDKMCAGSQAYNSLAGELLQRERGEHQGREYYEQ